MVCRHVSALVLVIALVPWSWSAGDESVRGIPLKPDPPVAIDESTAEWTRVPGAATIEDASQVVWGQGTWQSPQDLSGTVRVAWREECFFVAAEVRDDSLQQSQHGSAMWKGDHIELYLDVAPDTEPGRDAFGEGQFQIVLSPGNFRDSGDPLSVCLPEAFVHKPVEHSAEGIRVASSRTADGYILEAAIPWAVLGVAQPSVGMRLRYEVGLSDTDTQEPQQETLMTLSSGPWSHTRSRLLPAALAGADGIAPAIPTEEPVFDSFTLKRGEKTTVNFTGKTPPAGRRAVLSFQARMDFETVAGYTQALRITVNGVVLTGDRLVNKPRKAMSRGGHEYSLVAGDTFAVFYSPDFASPDTHPHYGLRDGWQTCVFDINLDGVLHEGENTLVLENAAVETVDAVLVVVDGRVGFQAPPPAPKPKAGPPTGPLPRIEPRALHKTPFTAEAMPGARIQVMVGGESFVVESAFSTPEPRWVCDSNRYFDLHRRLELRDEAVVVRDTFRNLTDDNLPLMHRHDTAMDTRDGLWLAGLKQVSTGGTSAPENPTTFASTARAGVGFLPLDDVFRVHVNNYATAERVGLADHHLVLKPGATYTAEWAIVPTETGDYFDFLNAARRLVDANFTIDGGFAFLRATPDTDAWSDQQIVDFLRLKDVRYACASNNFPLYDGHYTHGTAFQRVTHDNYRTAFERWRRLVPDIQCLVYFHCFLDVTEDGPDRFQDARLLRPDGAQADYGRSYYRIYLPLESNSFGPAVARNVDIILDKIRSDGVYWDEHEYSRWTYHYGEPWDEWTGDIDPERMTIRNLKSSVTLLTEPWRVALARKILARGSLIGNGAPYTRAIAALHFPCFVETGSISNCTLAHLHSPIALGDHLTEQSELDAYRVMLAALDYGCLYHWYNDMTIVPTHHHLTRYMFPFTPMELHRGYVIGKERIVTRVSGLFGWGDASGHEAHIFDDTGREVEDAKAPRIVEDGKTYTELRLPEDWSAAIVRRARD